MAVTIVLEVSPSDSTTARTILDAAKAALPEGARVSIVRTYEEPTEPAQVCRHCMFGIWWDDEDEVWRHDEHEGITCGSLSPDTAAEPND